MFAGLGLPASQAPLSDDEEETFEEFFAFLYMAPSEYYALPREKRGVLSALFQNYTINRLLLTRTATKKQ